MACKSELKTPGAWNLRNPFPQVSRVKLLYIDGIKKYGIVKFNILSVAMPSYFNPPRPAYYNPPIKPQYYAPNAFTIASISLGATTTVTINPTFYGASNNFVVGQLVRLVIPPFYGSYQLNNKLGYVIAIPAPDQVTLGIDSLGANQFIASPAYGPTVPQIIPVGDVNTGQINTGRIGNLTFIPGSFLNISPR